MKISHTFGTFIKEKRQQRDISLRKFADQIGISPVYLSNLENDRMSAPKDEVVSTMARLLLLNDADTAMLYYSFTEMMFPNLQKDMRIKYLPYLTGFPGNSPRKRKSINCHLSAKRLASEPLRTLFFGSMRP